MVIENQEIENLKFEDNINENIYISNTIVDTIDMSFMSFNNAVKIKGCQINHLLIHSSRFIKGFELENCVVKNKIQYEMGGHNTLPISILNNIFNEMFIFFDCHFTERVIIKKNYFHKGCSILASSMNNTFEQEYEIVNNIGNVDINQMD